MSRAIILGGSGFMGQALVRELRGGLKTVVYDLREPQLERPDVYVKGDMDDLEKITGIIEHGDQVVHLVHSTIPSESNKAPAKDVSTNLLRFFNLLEALADKGADRLIYASSGGTVYGDPEVIPVPENAPLRPVSGYGIVKMLMERYLQLFQYKKKLDYFIARISNPYGPCQELSNRHGAVPAIMRALKGSNTFTIFGDGNTLRDYIYIDDAARALSMAVQSDLRNRVFNIGTGRGTGLNELIDIIEAISGLKLEITRKPIRDSDASANVLDSSGIKAALGWKPATTLEEGLKRTWEYWCGLESG